MTLTLTDDAAAFRCDGLTCTASLVAERERGHEDPDDNDDDASLVERAGWLLRSRRWLAVGVQHFCPGHLPPPARVYTRDEVQAILRALWETRYAGTEYLIPPAATAVHGIDDQAVALEPSLVELVDELTAALTGVDLAGFNARAFDVPFLRAELARVGAAWPCADAAIVDAFEIFRTRERHTLDRAVRFYCARDHEGAHSAAADAAATLDVLLAQLAAYPDLPRDVADLAAATGGRGPDWATECGRLRWGADGHLVLAFSKHAGRRLYGLDAGFLAWMLRSDFPADVKDLVRRAQRGERPRREGGAS